MEIIEEDGKAGKIKLQKMKLGEADKSGRRRPIPIEGEVETIDVDLVIGAIGQEGNLDGFEALETTNWGTISVDESTFSTNLKGVFAGGDGINQGADIAIKAIGDARKASDVINSYLDGEVVPYIRPFIVERHNLSGEDFKDREKIEKSKMPHLLPEDRKHNFKEVNLGFDPQRAIDDAKRCLECGCHDVFECKLYTYANDYDVKPETFQGEVHFREDDDNHPFIVRNTDKCILCGLCVRVCEEVMDNGALGLADRGFDTIVKPSLDLPLGLTDCISCGQCVSVCPVGAIQERLQIEKSVPLKAIETKTICSFCSVGCNINLNTKGNMLYRAIPDEDSLVDNGLLCVRGRFGYDEAHKKSRLTKPLIRKNGILVETTWEEGLNLAAKKMQSLKMKYGGEGLGVSISDRYTNEEIFLAKKFAEDFLNTDYITSFNRNYGGIVDVLGYDASTNTFDELRQADCILLIGSDTMKDHTIAGLKIKEAVDKGGKLFVINDFNSQVDDWGTKSFCPENNVKILKEILKAIIDLGFTPENARGFEELKESLENIVPSLDAKEIATIYIKSKKAMLVFDQSYVTIEGAKLIANIAVVSGQIGKARRGIIGLKPKNNSQGLVDMEINRPNRDVIKAIEDKTLKGLMILGEDISGVNLDNLEFLIVQDLYLTPTGEKADLVLPGVSYAESEGTFTSSERRIQRINPAIPALTGYENWEVINEMMSILGKTHKYKHKYKRVEELTGEISRTIKEYSGVDKLREGSIWPLSLSKVLYEDGFKFPDKKARLEVVEDGVLFRERKTTDFVEKEFGKRVESIRQ